MFPEPRISVVPPYVRTAGPQIVKVAGLGGIVLDEAQTFLACAAGGVGADDKWSAFEVAVFAPRQNLKTELLIARVLAGLFVLDEELIVYSAHEGRTTRKTFKRLKRAIERSPELGGRIVRVSNRPGAEMIELSTGQALECVARSTSSGRGFTGDLVLLDEAQELDSESLGAILPMLSTRRNPQVWYCLSQGNPRSTHLGAMRERALAGDGPFTMWAEWSLADDDDVADRSVWRACNPAVAAGRIEMAFLEKQFFALGSDQFAIEHLGKSSWPTDETVGWEVIAEAVWSACGVFGTTSVHEPVAPVPVPVAEPVMVPPEPVLPVADGQPGLVYANGLSTATMGVPVSHNEGQVSGYRPFLGRPLGA